MSDTQSAHLPQSVLLPYTGGHTVVLNGYVYELCPDHPKANPFGFVPQHRLVLERLLGRYLKPSEHVHHIDFDPQNNSPENLQIVSRSQHLKIHRAAEREKKYPPLTYSIVEKALASGGLKAAARALGCNQCTIRNNFPELVEPYKRKSPANLDDPQLLEELKALAGDSNIGYREAADKLGISSESIGHILKRNNIVWVRKSKVGEVHRKYVRKNQEYHDDPELVNQVAQFASDKNCSYDNASHILGISTSSLQRICKRNNIVWVPKSSASYPVESE